MLGNGRPIRLVALLWSHYVSFQICSVNFPDGLIATKFPKAKLMFVAFGNLWQGLALALMPTLGDVNLFFAVSVVNGIGMGIMHTGKKLERNYFNAFKGKWCEVLCNL